MTSPTQRAGGRARGRTRRNRPGAPAYVCMAGIDWWYDSHAHSEAQLMRRIARTRRVLFVNSIGLRLPVPGRSPGAMRRILRKLASILHFIRRPLPDTPNFYVLSPLVVPLYTTRTGRALNAACVRAQVAVARRLLRIRDPILIVTLPTAWAAVRDLPRRSLIVNKVDKYSTHPDVDQSSVAAAEQELLDRGDVVVYVSRELMAEDLPITDGRAAFLDHGVDLEHFVARPPSEIPADLDSIPRPRIGYFGSLDDYRVDMDLVERMASEIPEAQVVLIGESISSMARFDALENVHWLGPRPYEQIPAYGSGFDVGVMPYLRNEWIRRSNPIKSREYLALGLPVVSTAVPQLDDFADVMLIANDEDDFLAKVRVALDGAGPSDPEGRRAAVSGCSWDNRAAEFLTIVEAVGS